MRELLLSPSRSSLSGDGKLRKDETSGVRGAEGGVENYTNIHRYMFISLLMFSSFCVEFYFKLEALKLLSNLI